MKFSDTLIIVTRNLKRRKGRTILTAIGVTIGTAAIVAMMSLAIGLKENAVRSISMFGSLTEIEVFPNYDMTTHSQVNKLDEGVAEQIRSIPGVKAVMPKSQYNSGQVELQVDRKTCNTEVIGVDALAGINFDYDMAEGKYLTGGSNEAVIGYYVPEMLREKRRPRRDSGEEQQTSAAAPASVVQPARLSDDVPRSQLVNHTVTLTASKTGPGGKSVSKTIKVKVVGMLSETRSSPGSSVIYVPLDTVRELNNWAGELQSGVSQREGRESYMNLTVRVPEREKVEYVVECIRGMGFRAFSPITELKEVNKAFFIIQMILGGIGAISLLVATIGIINTMVMSILERTREIGILKVLGATIPNIRKMFLIEAGTIGFLGGMAGLVISYAIAGIINLIYRSANFLGIPEEAVGDIAVIPVWLALFALTFATLVGVLAGIYPAVRAARLSPLNAIRQE